MIVGKAISLPTYDRTRIIERVRDALFGTLVVLRGDAIDVLAADVTVERKRVLISLERKDRGLVDPATPLDEEPRLPGRAVWAFVRKWLIRLIDDDVGRGP